MAAEDGLESLSGLCFLNSSLLSTLIQQMHTNILPVCLALCWTVSGKKKIAFMVLMPWYIKAGSNQMRTPLQAPYS